MRTKEEKAPLLYSTKNRLGFYTKATVNKEKVSAVENTFCDTNLIQYIARYLTISGLLRFRQVNREIYSAIMDTYADNVIALRQCHPDFGKINFNPKDIDIEANHSEPALFIDETQSPYTISQLLSGIRITHNIEQKIPKIQDIATVEYEVAEAIACLGRDEASGKCIGVCAILMGAIFGSLAGWAYSELFDSLFYSSVSIGFAVGIGFCLGMAMGPLYGLPPLLKLLSNSSTQRANKLSSTLEADSMRSLADTIKITIKKELKDQYVLAENEFRGIEEDSLLSYQP